MEVMLLPIGKKHEDLSAAEVEGDKEGSSKSPYNGKRKTEKVKTAPRNLYKIGLKGKDKNLQKSDIDIFVGFAWIFV